MSKDKLLKSIDKESDVYQGLSQVLEDLKEVARMRIELNMNYDCIAEDIKAIAELRLHYITAHSIACENDND